MSEDDPLLGGSDAVVDYIRRELAESRPSRRRRALEQFAMAGLNSIPWVGGLISAAIAMKISGGQVKTDDLERLWLEDHFERFESLKATLGQLMTNFESFGEEIDSRLGSDEFLQIVRKAFRVWDQADTDEKRKYIGNLIGNAGATTIASDDVVRLFVAWLDQYHETHFAVIRAVYQNPHATRRKIWAEIHPGALPRENSAEADLFKRLIRDLSTGGVIRQERETTSSGEFVARVPPARPKGQSRPAVRTLGTAFDDEDPYELTELGQQFVHYTMNELVLRIGTGE